MASELQNAPIADTTATDVTSNAKKANRRKTGAPKKIFKRAAGSNGDEGAAKRTKRYKPGTVALRQIKKYQKNTDLLLPRATFKRLVKEVADKVVGEGHYEYVSGGIRFKSSAIDAIQVRSNSKKLF
jgi:histone H3/H4